MRLQGVKFESWSAGLMGVALLGLMLGTSGTVKAQEGRDEAKPPQQEEPKQEEAKPERQKDAKPEAKPGRQQEPSKAEEGKPSKNEKENPAMKTGKEQPAERNGGDHAARASGQRGQRIPDDKFRSHFGRPHTFRIQKPVVVEGQPRFQYGGYWFVMVDPWPVGWDYSDEVYVDWIDGEYVLIDLLHPGVQIAVFVVE
jgi:hypothetical protein